MKNTLLPKDLRGCRDLIKGRSGGFPNSEHILADYARFRYQIKREFAPLRGERLRKTIIGGIMLATSILMLYIMFAS